MNWTEVWFWLLGVLAGVFLLSWAIAWFTRENTWLGSPNEHVHWFCTVFAVCTVIAWYVVLLGGAAVYDRYIANIESRARTTIARQLEMNETHVTVEITKCVRTEAGPITSENTSLFASPSPCVAWFAKAILGDGRNLQLEVTETSAEILSDP